MPSWEPQEQRAIERQTSVASNPSPFLRVPLGSPGIWSSFSLRYSRRDRSSKPAPLAWKETCPTLRLNWLGCCRLGAALRLREASLVTLSPFFPSTVIPPEKTCSKPLESPSSLPLEYSPNHMFFKSSTNSCSEL